MFHIESFVVPKKEMPTMEQVEDGRKACIEMDWKVQDMVIVVVAELPEEFLPGISSGGERPEKARS